MLIQKTQASPVNFKGSVNMNKAAIAKELYSLDALDCHAMKTFAPGGGHYEPILNGINKLKTTLQEKTPDNCSYTLNLTTDWIYTDECDITFSLKDANSGTIQLKGLSSKTTDDYWKNGFDKLTEMFISLKGKSIKELEQEKDISSLTEGERKIFDKLV